MYRSLNQSKDDFEKFCNKFELTVDALLATNSFLIVAIGGFNATGILATGISSNWYIGDTITFEGSKIDIITSQFGLQQTINDPTHIQGRSVSCIGLIFYSQPNLVMSSGITSLFTKIAIIR